MYMSPIISHTDIIFSIFKNRELMSTFSERQLNTLKNCIDLALKDKAIEVSSYDLLEDD